MESSQSKDGTLVGRSVIITISEPSGEGPSLPTSSVGRIRRLLNLASGDGRRYYKAVVELDMPLQLAGSRAPLLSVVSRSPHDDLPSRLACGSLPVNIAAEAAWILECREDDPRLRSGWEPGFLGFGGAKLLG